MEQEQIQEKKQRNYKPFLYGFWTIFILGFISFGSVFFLASEEVLGPMPTFEDLENPETKFATEIISSDGVTLGKFYNENRTPVKYKNLPQHLINALVATEDERFYQHGGIDFKGTFRAVIKLGKDGGASTITQQLSKLLFTKKYGTHNKFKRIIQKIKEWVIAVRLERKYTKEEIITMYFNKFDFLYNAIGIRSASRIYFGKEPASLKIEESAMLVAMLKNPRQYNPKRMRSQKKSLQRRNQVFNQMLKNNFIDKNKCDSLKKIPLKLNFTPEGHQYGYGTYFREYLRDFMKKWVASHPNQDGTKRNLYQDGLKIYITIDSRMQKNAEVAVKEHMSNLQSAFFKQQKYNPTAPFYNLTTEEIEKITENWIKNTKRYRTLKKIGVKKEKILASFEKKRKMKILGLNGLEKDTVMSPVDSIKHYKHFLHTGLLSMEPTTGKIKAWVGGINYKYFKYDHVMQGKRQLGSTFKPFVYASAIDQLRLSPCEKYPNTPYTIAKESYGMDEDWTPKNAGEKYGGELSLSKALAKSVNVITARLIHLVGPATVARLAKKAGFSSYIPPYPSIALGTVDANIYELVAAYSIFANKGIRIQPMVIEKITDKYGSVLEQFLPTRKQVLSETSAYLIISLLKGVTEFGSGVRLRSNTGKYPDDIVTGYPYEFKNPIAGKTGTTQNHSDGWFIGIVPNLITGVWTGASNRAIHFKDIARGQGASMSLPIWAIYMKKCYEDETLNVSVEDFEKPENINVQIDCPNDENDTPFKLKKENEESTDF